MLVWYYIPKGITDIPEMNLRIYGHHWSSPPHEVPYEIYRKYKSMLVLAPYTDEWLSRKYGVCFDPIAFTYHEIKDLPYEVLYGLAAKMGVLDGRGRPKHKTLAMAVRKSLRSL